MKPQYPRRAQISSPSRRKPEIKPQFFSTDFRKILKYQISRECVLWESSCSMKTDGHTDMRRITVAFRNFAKAPKNQLKYAAA